MDLARHDVLFSCLCHYRSSAIRSSLQFDFPPALFTVIFMNTLPQYLVAIFDPNWKPANIANSSPALDGAEKVHISSELHDESFGLESIVMEEWCSRDIADPNYLLYLDNSCASNGHHAFRNPKCMSSKRPAKVQLRMIKGTSSSQILRSRRYQAA